MTDYAKAHEAMVVDAIEKNEVTEALLVYHKERIEWLQHERLIHLMVFLFTAAALITFFVVSMFVDNIWLIVLVVILLILSGFYCAHYYYLENTVQRWYKLADKMTQVITPMKK